MSALSTEDEGKFLIDAEGGQIAVLTDENAAYVEPDLGIGGCPLGFEFGDADDDIEVPDDSVETITDIELRVPRDL